MAERETHPWELIYTDWDPAQQPLREALCALGNGYITTRGAFEEVQAGGPHYPGTYLAGGYNRLETEMAGRVLHLLDEKRRRDLSEDLAITDEELVRWEDVSRRMFVPFHDEGIISQFEGYETLQAFEWDGYRETYGDIHRLDRILEAEDDDVNRYKASKQADVLMLFYLFSSDALQDLFEHMGYAWNPDLIPRTIEYYMQRTSHGSTLSRVVHSWVLARANREGAWQLFKEALHSDIDDIQGGTTPEGIHLGAMAGTIDLIQRAHTGIEMRDGVLWFNPLLPYELSDVRLRVHYRGHWLSLHLTDKQLTVSFDRGWSDAVRLGFRDEVHSMEQGETCTFDLGGATRTSENT